MILQEWEEVSVIKYSKLLEYRLMDLIHQDYYQLFGNNMLKGGWKFFQTVVYSL